MSLAAFKPETRQVKGKNYDLTVRGLSMTDVASLLRTHLEDLDHVFELYEQQGADSMGTVALSRFALALIKDSPGLVAHAIALACDEPDQVENAARLPFPAQIAALKDIGTLTFEGIGGIKKFAAEFSDLVSGLRPPQQEMQ